MTTSSSNAKNVRSPSKYHVFNSSPRRSIHVLPCILFFHQVVHASLRDTTTFTCPTCIECTKDASRISCEECHENDGLIIKRERIQKAGDASTQGTMVDEREKVVWYHPRCLVKGARRGIISHDDAYHQFVDPPLSKSKGSFSTPPETKSIGKKSKKEMGNLPEERRQSKRIEGNKKRKELEGGTPVKGKKLTKTNEMTSPSSPDSELLPRKSGKKMGEEDEEEKTPKQESMVPTADDTPKPSKSEQMILIKDIDAIYVSHLHS